MNSRKYVAVGVAAWLLGVCLCSAAGAADPRAAMKAALHLGEARGPVRPVDLSPSKLEVSSEILAGPANGLDSSFIIYDRLAAGAKPKGLYELPVEQTFLVLSGKLNVQIGTDQFVAGPETLVMLPAGVPRQVWNAGAEPAVDLQVVEPARSRDLVSMMKPAVARKIDNAAQLIRVAPALGKLVGGSGHDSLNERVLASRDNGSEFLERLNSVLPGGGRTELHVHPFDQAYFVMQGTMTVRFGLKKYEVNPDSLVIIPAGTVHSNLNNGTGPQTTITLLLPEQKQGIAAGSDIEIQGTPVIEDIPAPTRP